MNNNDERMTGPVDLFGCRKTKTGYSIELDWYKGTFDTPEQARFEANTDLPGHKVYAIVDTHGHRSFFDRNVA